VADNLYDLGWQQGTMFSQSLSAVVIGRPDVIFDRWIVCTQDCDLSSSSPTSTEAIVELRPVLKKSPPADWGIRSSRLLLNSQEYVDASTARVQVTAAKICEFDGARDAQLLDERLRAFKTWLGRRYDRPAVPEHFINLAREIAKRCVVRSGRQIAQAIHDVLMQFSEDSDPPQVALYAVATDEADLASVKRWLADVASRIDTKLGVVAHIGVQTRAQTSLQLIETSYSADLSQLTWINEFPVGAE
jgi:hypothetical protein